MTVKISVAMARGSSRPARRLAGLRSLVALSGLLGIALIASAGGDVSAAPTAQSAAPFTFNFVGNPKAPQPWDPTTWDVVVNSRDTRTFAQLEGMQAQHGADCSGPPATHFNDSYEGAVFLCHDHVMTAINAHGYGEIVLTPDHMVDLTGGTAQVMYNVSTYRASFRDWYDIWLTPFADNLVLPINTGFENVDLQGPPKEAIHIKLDQFNGGSVFHAEEYANYRPAVIPGNSWTSIESLVPPSAATRSRFEIDISSTHLRFGIPTLPEGGSFWFFNHDFPHPLSSTQYVVQIAHHSYNPTKSCTLGTQHCLPDTWHWSNFFISNAVPFTLLRGDIQVVNAGTSAVVNFPAPAPKSAFLRFAAIGSIDVGVDGGKSWQPARRQAQSLDVAGHFASFWMTVPEGAKSVAIRGRDWFAGPWWVRDISIWSTSVNPTGTAGNAPAQIATSPTSAPQLATQGVLAAFRSPVAVATSATLVVGLLGAVSYLLWLRRRRARLTHK